jgi:phosphoribosylaminoimidazolecarboxamide formyltransferase/IMP cyclohydrolase
MKDLKQAYKTVMDDNFPEDLSINFGGQTLIYKKRTWKIDEDGTVIKKGLRYGENPGQEAAMYQLINGNLVLGDCSFIEAGHSLTSSIDESMMVQFGKHPGKTNITDIDNALNILKFLDAGPAAVIIKHNNPCGVAKASTPAEAFNKAFRADKIAAFGGCVAFNRAVDKDAAELIAAQYLEVVVAPDYIDGAVEILAKRKNLRIVKIGDIEKLQKYQTMRFLDFKSLIDGGLIIQQSPINTVYTKDDFKIAETVYKDKTYKIDRQPSVKEYEDMIFGWHVEQGVTSNSVIYVKDGVTVGIGTGEQDRVGVAEIAVYKAYTKYADLLSSDKYDMSYKSLELEVNNGNRDASEKETIDKETQEAKGGLIGATAVSDAFFPFRDGVDVLVEQGISAIIQPGGSMRDFESIEACNEADPKITMVYTGQRDFKH